MTIKHKLRLLLARRLGLVSGEPQSVAYNEVEGEFMSVPGQEPKDQKSLEDLSGVLEAIDSRKKLLIAEFSKIEEPNRRQRIDNIYRALESAEVALQNAEKC